MRDFALPWPRPRLRLSNPLLFQSKILSLSLLYLLTTLPLSIYTSFSPSSSCPFSPPPPPILPSTNLFSYPNSYRVHKHALPTARSACTSPIPFPGNLILLFLGFYDICHAMQNCDVFDPWQSMGWLSGRWRRFAGTGRDRIPLLWCIWRGEEPGALPGTSR